MVFETFFQMVWQNWDLSTVLAGAIKTNTVWRTNEAILLRWVGWEGCIHRFELDIFQLMGNSSEALQFAIKMCKTNFWVSIKDWIHSIESATECDSDWGVGGVCGSDASLRVHWLPITNTLNIVFLFLSPL